MTLRNSLISRPFPLCFWERIRGATLLNKAIVADPAAHELTSETAGLEVLFPAVGSLYPRVVDLL